MMVAPVGSGSSEGRLDYIDLSLGDPCYGPPDQAKAAAAAAILYGGNGYLAPGGLPTLRSALALKLQNQNKISATADQVVITVGASLGLFATLAVLCQPQDGVLIPDPGFPLYRLMTEIQRLKLLRYRLQADANYEPNWDSLAELASQACVLVWNFPSNPLGTVARPEWLPRLHSLLATHPRLYLISDEVYEDLLFTHAHSSPAASAGPLAERCLSIFSFSKSYGMTGWRVGYVHAPGGWAAHIEKTHWGAAMSAPTIAQRAALVALQAPTAYREKILAFLSHNRAEALARLRRWTLPCREPEGGFFVWVNINRSGLDSLTFAARCAEECRVLVSPGIYFILTTNEYIRLSFAVDTPVLAEGLDRIGCWVSNLYLSGSTR